MILLFALMFLPIIGWGHFGDEHEQATAGYLIWHGLLPYKDFFSHHAPLPLLLSALYKFIPINNQVLALRALVAVLQIGAWTWLLSVSQKQFKAVIYLVITLLALALPTFSLQMMLADTLVTTAFALILLTTIQYWWLKQPNLGTVLRVFLIGSFVMIWSSVASTLLVLLMGLLILAAGHQQQKKQVKEQFKKYLAIWTGLQLIFPGIYLLIGRFREFWWQLVTYNNQYYFPLKLARTQAQRDGGMLFRIVDEFWLMISGELATFFGSLLVLARSVLGSWRLFFDTNSDWVGYFSLVWREFGQNFASVRFDLSVGIGLIFLWLILRKRWQLAIVFVLTALASFFRSSETFHLGPEFVLVIVGLSLMVVKSWRKGRRRSRPSSTPKFSTALPRLKPPLHQTTNC